MSAAPSCQKIFKALGTVNAIYVPHCESAKAVSLAVDRVMELDGRLSVFKRGSDVSMVNKNAGERFVKVHADTMRILKKSAEISALSYGAFDVTSGPLVDLWGIGMKQDFIPDERAVRECRQLVGFQGLVFDDDNGRVMLRRKGQKICLGGIGKGYAADEVKKILAENHVSDALINLGGNIIAMGRQSLQKPWTIGIQNPMRRTGVFFGTLSLKDETAVTSGSNEQFFIKDGKRYHHIIDPRTGRPADTDMLSVTLIGHGSAAMDALATAVFVLGMHDGQKLLTGNRAQAIFVRRDGSVFLTKGLIHRFHLRHDAKEMNLA